VGYPTFCASHAHKTKPLFTMLDSISTEPAEGSLGVHRGKMSSTYTTTEELPKRTLIATQDPILTIDELIRRRASELRDSPLIGYPKSGVTDYEEHSAVAVNQYVDAAAHVLQRRGLKKVVSTRNAQTELALTSY